MRKEECERLLQDFYSAQKSGTNIYLDPITIEDMLDLLDNNRDINCPQIPKEDAEEDLLSEEMIDKEDCYKDLLEFGLRLHPDNTNLLIKKCRWLIEDVKYVESYQIINTINEKGIYELDVMRLECLCYFYQFDRVWKFIDKLLGEGRDYVQLMIEQVAIRVSLFCSPDDTIEFLVYGLELFPDSVFTKEILADILIQEKEYPQAIILYNELIDQNSYSGDLWKKLGEAYMENNQYDKAIEAFDFALSCKLTTSIIDVIYKKGVCLFNLRSYEKAIEVFTEKSNLHRFFEDTTYYLAESHIMLEHYEQGYELYKSVFHSSIKPKAKHYLSYFQCCLETNREEEGFELFEQAKKLFPDDIFIIAIQDVLKEKEDIHLTDSEVVREMFHTIQAVIEYMETSPDLKQELDSRLLRYHLAYLEEVPAKEIAQELLSKQENKN